MKSYRNAIAALVLVFVFSTSATANAGIIWTEKTPPPPPPQATGIIWTEAADPAPEDDDLTEIALTLLQTLLPLL
ncbi:MAG: hypothetical protein LC803_17450 [Acidobacteria bacterium]|nr:hypothetical protein [Acidobacteriota bacterium]